MPRLEFLRENLKNISLDEFLDFYEFNLHMIFNIFHENGYYRNSHF